MSAESEPGVTSDVSRRRVRELLCRFRAQGPRDSALSHGANEPYIVDGSGHFSARPFLSEDAPRPVEIACKPAKVALRVRITRL